MIKLFYRYNSTNNSWQGWQSLKITLEEDIDYDTQEIRNLLSDGA